MGGGSRLPTHLSCRLVCIFYVCVTIHLRSHKIGVEVSRFNPEELFKKWIFMKASLPDASKLFWRKTEEGWMYFHRRILLLGLDLKWQPFIRLPPAWHTESQQFFFFAWDSVIEQSLVNILVIQWMLSLPRLDKGFVIKIDLSHYEVVRY